MRPKPGFPREARASALSYKKLKYEKQQLIAWHAEQEASLKQLRDQQDVVGHLNRLPSSVSDAVELIEKLHPATIAFTPQAKQAAKATAFTDTGTAWRILWATATTLHALYFNNADERLDIAKRFKELTGFDLALSEGRNTTRDNKLMALRKQDYNGTAIDITPHVKYGNRAPKLLRVHYYPDRERRRILIGHCGDHLENFSTAKA
jgi:hypothetical protein